MIHEPLSSTHFVWIYVRVSNHAHKFYSVLTQRRKSLYKQTHGNDGECVTSDDAFDKRALMLIITEATLTCPKETIYTTGKYTNTYNARDRSEAFWCGGNAEAHSTCLCQIPIIIIHIL